MGACGALKGSCSEYTLLSGSLRGGEGRKKSSAGGVGEGRAARGQPWVPGLLLPLHGCMAARCVQPLARAHQCVNSRSGCFSTS